MSIAWQAAPEGFDDRASHIVSSDHLGLIRNATTSASPNGSISISKRISKLLFSSSPISRCLAFRLKIQIDPASHAFF
jgi:hypothetical protein